MEPIAKTHEKVIRYTKGEIKEVDDLIVTEHPVTIKLNGEEFATLVCTPEYIEEMAIGFLASEGVIQSFDDIDEIWVQEKEGFVHVKTSKFNPLFQQFHSKRYITSCCGKSRQGFVFFNDARIAKKMHGIDLTLTFADCFKFMEDMQNQAFMFNKTGGVHNAALYNKEGHVLSRMDIGRHNALDKIYGHCLKNHIPMEDKIVAFSGRISSEILLKVSKLGCGVILSKSAPTALSLELAENLGITTVGFIRGDSCNVYTHPYRIKELAKLK